MNGALTWRGRFNQETLLRFGYLKSFGTGAGNDTALDGQVFVLLIVSGLVLRSCM